ncbi:MAG: ABC transporter substrate-binding protein [Cyclobacteriaceae bacterium]|nr:ABC transporter substrate-binding protein [Cyclobacteriaceae bacterium]
MRLIHIALSIALFITSNVAFSQKSHPDEAKLNNGRELLKLGKYGLAMQALRPLTSAFENSPYQTIASFYFAVAAYHDKQKYVARDMFLQITRQYPKWKKIDEVNLWLTNLYLQEGDYNAATLYAQKIQDEKLLQEALNFKKQYVKKLDFEQLELLLEDFPDDKEIAIALANQIISKPLSEQDRGLLENIVSVHELETSKYLVDDHLQSVKKDRYQVALLLPFMTNELKANAKYISNEFVIELYEGILMGVSDLKSKGINISLSIYDTRQDSSTTARILKYDELKHMDLIIGPLYPGPVKVVTDFCYKYKINMINPLSSNSEIVGNNPFAFLFMPTDETMAKKAAEYMVKTQRNKNALIFYGNNSRDSTVAFTYKQTIESMGFKVRYMSAVATENAKNILNLLTTTMKVEVDQSEFDELLDNGKVRGNMRITEKEYLTIKPDSIGHVFVASQDPALVANTISGLETRGDSISLLGFERWLDQRNISIEGLERLQTHLIAPTFIDDSKPKYDEVNTQYMKRFNAYPTRNFYIGYEAMMTAGKLMKKNGQSVSIRPGYRPIDLR